MVVICIELFHKKIYMMTEVSVPFDRRVADVGTVLLGSSTFISSEFFSISNSSIFGFYFAMILDLQSIAEILHSSPYPNANILSDMTIEQLAKPGNK